MASNKKAPELNLIVKSIGVCLAQPNDKKKPSKVVIAYKTGDGIDSVKFVFMKAPTKVVADRQSFLSTIAEAEGVDSVTYVTYGGVDKDIYVCREDKGAVMDVVERDYTSNRYVDGYTEVLASALKFTIEQPEDYAKSLGKAFKPDISAGIDAEYAKGSYEYAIINAYNACLLGSVLEREELQLETRDRQKIGFEFRRSNTEFVVKDKLHIYPVFKGLTECVDYYVTEEFSYIDGEDMRNIVYRIIYTNRLNDYNLVRE